MTRTKKVLLAIAVIVAALLLLLLSAPSIAKRSIANKLAQHPEVQIQDLRVSWLLKVSASSLRYTSDEIDLHCRNLEAHPYVLRRAVGNRLLRDAHLERCELQVQWPEPSEEASESLNEEPKGYSQTLQKLDDKLREQLLKVSELSLNSLHIRIVRQEQEHLLRANNLHWEIEFNKQRASAIIDLSELFDVPELRIEYLHAKHESQIELRSEQSFQYKEISVDAPLVQIRNWERVELPELTLVEPHELIARASLQNVAIELQQPLLLSNERGQILLNVSDILPDEFKGTDDSKLSDNNLPRVIEEPVAPELLWSLRSLERSRVAFQKVATLLQKTERDWPLTATLANIQVDEGPHQTLLDFSEIRFGNHLPLELHGRILDTGFSLQNTPENPAGWDLSIEGASLKHLAAIIELDEHLTGSIDANIHVELADDELRLDGSVLFLDTFVQHKGLSEETVGPFQIENSLSLRFPFSAKEAVHAEMRSIMNGVPLKASLDILPVDDRARFVATLGTDGPQECQSIWEAIPEGLLPQLKHRSLSFVGEAAPAIHLNYVAGIYSSFQLTTEGFPGSCLILPQIPRFDPAELNERSYVFHVSEGVSRDDIYVGPGTRDYVALHKLPSYVPALMYLSEEIDFYTNPGISIRLINKGIRHSLPRRRFSYGGSSVTQQLVKNLYFTRTKTLARKLQEAMIVWAVESVVSKDRILEMYINCIEFGPDLYGIVRASKHYFHKDPSELTPLEAAWLASLKPSPRRGARDFERGFSGLNDWNSRRNEQLLRRLVEYGQHIPQSEVESYAPYVVLFQHSPNAGATPTGYEAARKEALEQLDKNRARDLETLELELQPSGEDPLPEGD